MDDNNFSSQADKARYRRALVVGWLAFTFGTTSLLQANLGFVELVREGAVTTIQQTATDSEGGIFATRPRGCIADKPDHSLSTIYAPAPFLVETRINDALVLSNIVLREQPPRGRDPSEDRSTLRILSGTLEFNDREVCPESINEATTPQVTLKQGRTTVVGSSLTYLNSTGLGEMKGPISLQRIAEGDSPALESTAETLEYDTDTNKMIMLGGTVIRSAGRTSHADVVEFDEANGIAVLKGNPATSQEGPDMIQGNEITYYLNTNDVVVTGNVRGQFEIGVDDENSSSNGPSLGSLGE